MHVTRPLLSTKRSAPDRRLLQKGISIRNKIGVKKEGSSMWEFCCSRYSISTCRWTRGAIISESRASWKTRMGRHTNPREKWFWLNLPTAETTCRKPNFFRHRRPSREAHSDNALQQELWGIGQRNFLQCSHRESLPYHDSRKWRSWCCASEVVPTNSERLSAEPGTEVPRARRYHALRPMDARHPRTRSRRSRSTHPMREGTQE